MVLPGEGRVPYTPLPRRRPAYSGRLIVPREEGIVESKPYGQQIKLVCQELTGDERFTLAERTYDSGVSWTVEEGEAEAIHILAGSGTFRAWPQRVPDDQPIQVPLQPGMEIVIDRHVKHQIQNTDSAPLVAVVTICHLDFPAYPHHYPDIFVPGTGNTLHQHDNRVEAFYVVAGPGAMAIADPDNHSVQDLPVPAGGAGYLPMHVFHRMFNPAKPEETDEPCYWIHSMVVFTHRGSRLPQVHIRQHELDGRTPIWLNRNRL